MNRSLRLKLKDYRKTASRNPAPVGVGPPSCATDANGDGTTGGSNRQSVFITRHIPINAIYYASVENKKTPEKQVTTGYFTKI